MERHRVLSRVFIDKTRHQWLKSHVEVAVRVGLGNPLDREAVPRRRGGGWRKCSKHRRAKWLLLLLWWGAVTGLWLCAVTMLLLLLGVWAARRRASVRNGAGGIGHRGLKVCESGPASDCKQNQRPCVSRGVPSRACHTAGRRWRGAEDIVVKIKSRGKTIPPVRPAVVPAVWVAVLVAR